MEKKTQIWKYQRDFSYKEGVSTEGLRYDLRNDRAEPPVLLSDQQMNHFLAHGWLQLDTKLPLNYHQSLFKKFNGIVGEDNDVNPGNNLLPVVPELNLVFDDPVIKGALTSVLGKSYMMHPHRVLHDNPPGSEAQVWHHDSYWGYKRKVHNHHPWWVMIVYYPQDMFEEIGHPGYFKKRLGLDYPTEFNGRLRVRCFGATTLAQQINERKNNLIPEKSDHPKKASKMDKSDTENIAAKLKELKSLLDDGVITGEDYAKKKADLLE